MSTSKVFDKKSKTTNKHLSWSQKLIYFIFVLMLGVVMTPKQAFAFSDGIFKIQSTYSPDYVIDQYGDGITRSSTKAHLFNKNQTSTTSLLRKKSMSQGSSEIALAQDMNVCMSTELGLNQAGIRNGTKLVFKRDCANSNNWIEVGDTIRPWRNQKFCIDSPNGQFGNFVNLQLYECNGSVAQSFKPSDKISDDGNWYDGSCYRKPNFGWVSHSCSFTSNGELKEIALKSGQGFDVQYTTADNKGEAYLGSIQKG